MVLNNQERMMMDLGRWKSAVLLIAALSAARISCAAELAFRAQEISNQLSIGYATRLVDMNEDGKTDIVVVDTQRVIWFENPTWRMHTLIEGQTKADNVSIAPYDIDCDGKVDFALGADWRPADTRTSGTIQWLSRGPSASDKWTVHPIGAEPTVHRVRFADLDGDGRAELIVVPLFGRATTSPHFAETPVRILAYKIPADPVKGPWTPQVINEELHVAHNFWPTDLDHDGKLDLVVASFEGVSLLKRQGDGGWARTLIGEGNQTTSPNRGASEIKHGRLASGADYLATIEPWHGFQVVVYTRPSSAQAGAGGEQPLWTRQVLDEELKWGHAVWCADLDGDGDEELVIGVRDTKDKANPCGLRIYDPQGAAWTKQMFDPAGVAIEDLAVADLDGDGKLDIVAVGRQTKNVRIYWNETAQKSVSTAREPASTQSAAADEVYPPETLPNSAGGDLSLAAARGKMATVLVCMSVECPISSEYIPTLNRLADNSRPRGVNVIAIDPSGGETLAGMADHAREFKLAFPFLKDTGGKISRRLRFKVTPEVCVFDAAGKAVYRGRIDDRYRARAGSTSEAVSADLQKAVDEIVAGKPVSNARTKPVGCPIQLATD